MLKRYRYVLFLLLIPMLAVPFEADAQVQVVKGKRLGGQVNDLCRVDDKTMQFSSAEDGSVEIIFDRVCNAEGKLLSLSDINTAFYENPATQIMLNVVVKDGSLPGAINIEGQKAGSREWTPLVSAAYDLNPNELSILLTEVYLRFRLRVTPEGNANGSQSVEVNALTLGPPEATGWIFGGPLIGTYTFDAERGCSAGPLPVRASGAGLVEVRFEGACNAKGTFVEPHPKAGWDEGVAAFHFSTTPRCANNQALPLKAEVSVQMQETLIPLARFAVTPSCDGQTLSFNIGMPPAARSDEALSFNIGMPPMRNTSDADIGPIFLLRVYSALEDLWGMGVGLRVSK